MIWIIASIPFWIVGGLMGIGGSGAIFYGLFSAKVSQKEFNQVSPVAAIVALAGGLLMVIAAKLCS